jgi:hypothetical protein
MSTQIATPLSSLTSLIPNGSHSTTDAHMAVDEDEVVRLAGRMRTWDTSPSEASPATQGSGQSCHQLSPGHPPSPSASKPPPTCHSRGPWRVMAGGSRTGGSEGGPLPNQEPSFPNQEKGAKAL